MLLFERRATPIAKQLTSREFRDTTTSVERRYDLEEWLGGLRHVIAQLELGAPTFRVRLLLVVITFQAL